MDGFGPSNKNLTWDVEEPSDSVDFLDLTVTLDENGTVTTKTFQKDVNTYLYRTPNSCEPPTHLKSFIYGAIHRFYWQNTFQKDFLQMIQLLLNRLEDRGHLHRALAPLFTEALEKVVNSKLPDPHPGTNNKKQKLKATSNDSLFLHLPYHPNNPTKPELRHIIKDFKNDLDKYGLPLERIIIAYSKAPNIGDLCKKHRLKGFICTSNDP